MGRVQGFEQIWVQNLSCPFFCVTWAKFLNFFKAPVLSPINVMNACLPGLLRGLNKVKFVICLSLYVVHSRYSGNA